MRETTTTSVRWALGTAMTVGELRTLVTAIPAAVPDNAQVLPGNGMDEWAAILTTTNVEEI